MKEQDAVLKRQTLMLAPGEEHLLPQAEFKNPRSVNEDPDYEEIEEIASWKRLKRQKTLIYILRLIRLVYLSREE